MYLKQVVVGHQKVPHLLRCSSRGDFQLYIYMPCRCPVEARRCDCLMLMLRKRKKTKRRGRGEERERGKRQNQLQRKNNCSSCSLYTLALHSHICDCIVNCTVNVGIYLPYNITYVLIDIIC